MKIARIYTGDDNQSHFEDPNIELNDLGASGRIADPWAAKLNAASAG